MLHRILREIVEKSLAPAVDCLVSRDGEIVFRERFPCDGQPLLFDTASLTKPLVTFPLVRNRLGELNTPINEILPEAGISATLGELLGHKAGLKPWLPIYLFEENYLSTIRQRGLEPAGKSKKAVYSCLGYILLSRAVARVVGNPYGEIVRDFLKDYPGCEVNPGPRPDVAPTEHGNQYELKLAAEFVADPDRSLFRLDRDIHGETHDLNAFHDGGISGNAGLFATAKGAMKLLQALLHMEDVFLPLMEGPGYRYHLGFTGTGIAVSEDCRTVAVFLSNRVHPEVGPGDFSAVRHDVFCAVMEMFA
ncbi:MAG: beta-lactamase family protein [Acidobacteria bacterium]|nr:beta-lactamase family protein [Acidobacteriota bacterium]